MSVVLKVSKSGYDALTTGNANLAFSSELATHSVYSVQEVTVGAGVNTYTINHNLGFVPKVWIMVDDGTFSKRVPQIVIFDRIDYYITDSDIVIQKEFTGQSYTFRVIIFTRSPNP